MGATSINEYIEVSDLAAAVVALDLVLRHRFAQDEWNFDEHFAPKLTGVVPSDEPPTPLRAAMRQAYLDAVDDRTGAPWRAVRVGDPSQFLRTTSTLEVPVPDYARDRVSFLVERAARDAMVDEDVPLTVVVPTVRFDRTVPLDELTVVGWAFVGWVD